MIRFLEYGKIESVENSRAVVLLSGYDGDARVDALIAFPGGGSSVKTWIPPQPGDVVAVIVDDERPEDSLVVGGLYVGGQSAPMNGEKIAFQAPEVRFGASVSDAEKVARDDRVQVQLTAIKNALDALVEAFNSHTHPIPDGITSAPEIPASHGYSVGDTAADSVWVK